MVVGASDKIKIETAYRIKWQDFLAKMIRCNVIMIVIYFIYFYIRWLG